MVRALGSGKRRTLVGQLVLRCQLNDGALAPKSQKNQQDEVTVTYYRISPCAGGQRRGPPRVGTASETITPSPTRRPAEADAASLGEEIARLGFG